MATVQWNNVPSLAKGLIKSQVKDSFFKFCASIFAFSIVLLINVLNSDCSKRLEFSFQSPFPLAGSSIIIKTS